MFNHFASLLANLDLAYTAPTQESYLLADELSNILATAAGEFIALNDYYTVIERSKVISVLINKDYTPILLPPELQKFYDILFPANASLYYKQFLLYTYLRIIAATDRYDDVKKYDSRITYTLDDLTDYFRFTKVSVPRSSDPNYRLLVSGNLTSSEDVNYFLNSFIVTQVAAEQSVRLFSSTQLKYYKQGKPPSGNPIGMEIVFNINNNISETIPVGDTGINLNISGPFDSVDPTKSFGYSGNKLWAFTAETPFNLDFNRLLSDISSHDAAVEGMLSYNKNFCDANYESIWRTHYNDVYRLAGLLLAYVERVDYVWRTQM
jgi:hypothetical protein